MASSWLRGAYLRLPLIASSGALSILRRQTADPYSATPIHCSAQRRDRNSIGPTATFTPTPTATATFTPTPRRRLTFTPTPTSYVNAYSHAHGHVRASGDYTHSPPAHKNKGFDITNLFWTGAPSNNIDIYRNGVLKATVPTSEPIPITRYKGSRHFHHIRCATSPGQRTIALPERSKS